MSLGERISQLIEDKKVTSYIVATNTGISESTLSLIRRGKTPNPSQKTITSLANYFKVSESWLRTGIEDEILNDQIIITDSKRLPDKSVPYWNLPVSAGKSILDIIGKTNPDGYIKGLPGADLAENILPVMGTSMEPEISNGALIGVRLMNSWDTLNTERIYLIITGDDRMIKRIEYDEIDETILWCLSPNYAKFKIYIADIIEIQRVCFVYNPK
jgi:transcriptional regulator with XRE-family HTH domain